MLNFMYRLYASLERLPLLGRVFRKLAYPIQFFLYFVVNHESRRQWEKRIRLVLSSPDNGYIPRVSNAGALEGGDLIMHNGIRVSRGSYYGVGMHLMLKKNRGVHEPQEERVFMEVLKLMPENALMIELGAYWGFYSMWFHQEVTKPMCYLVEPVTRNIEGGKENFRINDMHGNFTQAFVGADSQDVKPIPTICIDDFMHGHGVTHVDILHSDIQGAELDMLRGARSAFEARKIDYVFVSTHTNDLHDKCRDFLREMNFTILADVNVDETYSEDGILVARREELDGLMPVPVSKR